MLTVVWWPSIQQLSMGCIIQHACIYCKRCFRGSARRYLAHLRKHRQRFHKYRYQSWKSDIKRSKCKKQQEYSKDFSASALPKVLQDTKYKVTQSIQGQTVDLKTTSNLSNPQPQVNPSDSLSVYADHESNESELHTQNENASHSQIPTHKNEDGPPSLVPPSQRTPTKTEKKVYKCSFCEKTFSGASYVLLHERTHTGEKPHSCRFCPKSFAQKGYLKIHERIHTGERPYSCGFCEKAFCTKEDLRRHERIHTGEKPYKCKFCGRGFSQRSYRNKHEMIHSGDRPFASKPPELDFFLGGAGDSSQSSQAITDALKEAGLSNIIDFNHLTKLQTLPVAQQQEFMESITTVEGRGRGRPRGSSNKTNFCRFCGRDCRSSSQLRQHERTHTGEKPYSCKYCHKSFSQQGYARIHERIHTGERPFSCNSCNKAFSAKEDLRRHQRTHTGEKPYTCEVCGKAFAQNSALIGHRKTHLNDVSSLDYSSHSFLGLQPGQADGNLANYLSLGDSMQTVGSAHLLQMMASKVVSGSAQSNVPVNSEKTEFFGQRFELLGEKVPSLGENTKEHNHTQDSGHKILSINDIAARLLTSQINSDTSNTNGCQDDNIQYGQPSSLISSVPDEYVTDSRLFSTTYKGLHEKGGISIVDHIRMQLDIPIPTDESHYQSQTILAQEEKLENLENPRQSPTTQKEKQETFENKKNKINNLASLLLSAKTSKQTPTQENENYTGRSSVAEHGDQVWSASGIPAIMKRNVHSADDLIGTIDKSTPTSQTLDKSTPTSQTLDESKPKPVVFSLSEAVGDKIYMNKFDGSWVEVKQEQLSTGDSLSSSEQVKGNFVMKKNKINDLASHLLSIKTSQLDPGS